jgi:hypothetical protein
MARRAMRGKLRAAQRPGRANLLLNLSNASYVHGEETKQQREH